MTRTEAMNILLKEGWNTEGAEAIIDEIELEEITEDDLLNISEDYKDR